MNSSGTDPLWYKRAVIYQLHVKAFCDSTSDGIGDFRGLISKLDYLVDLGVTALWLLPFYPSPQRDDGYDIADYTAVHPSYGTLEDFKAFLDAAHARGMKVITELVLNHTSDQHAWFQRARKAPPGSPERDWYVWSDTPDRYREARIIFRDFEHSNWSWDPVAKAYFWHRFYAHQPDLNFENPEVQAAMFSVLDFWLGLGVDGLRLDAVPYLFEREGTSCENLPETHDYLRKLRAHIDARFQDRMLLAEANQWPEDAVAYFGEGTECHMAFHFPVMPRMFMALQMEDRFPIIDILDQTPKIPESCQWAMFLRNHDELTLEMVTDEERDYMYRVYAADPRARINQGIRRRLTPLLGNNRRKIELMNMLLLSLPGTPIIYYGDEIGMGDNYYLGDRNGVRTPMQWSGDRNAGFSQGNPQQLFLPVIIDSEYHFESVNVETQEKNRSSLLWWMRRLIEMRGRFSAFGSGTMEFISTDNTKVLAFVRRHEAETILVLANLSRFVQAVELDLSAFIGMIPVEVFGQGRFPVVKQDHYFLTLGSHDHYWLALEPALEASAAGGAYVIPEIDQGSDLKSLLTGKGRSVLERHCLPRWLAHCRWFAGKAKALRGIKITGCFPVEEVPGAACVAVVGAAYADAQTESYLVPLQTAAGDAARTLLEQSPNHVLAKLADGAVLHDAVVDEPFRAALLKMIAREEHHASAGGELAGRAGRSLAAILEGPDSAHPSVFLKAEQSNSSIVYDGRLFLKLYRRLSEGASPDCELIRFLSEKAKFPHVPEFCGEIELRRPGAEPSVLGILTAMVPNEGDAWTYTLDAVARFYERVLEKKTAAVAREGLDQLVVGGYIERVRQLAQRTAEMHLALASEADDPAFAPEPFNLQYQRSLYQSMRETVRRMVQQVQRKLHMVPEVQRAEIAALADLEPEIFRRISSVQDRIGLVRIRVHGDYHLGQVLNTGNDFVIIDFEGEPARSLPERRMKRCALRDVAGMLRSFHYAACSGLWQHASLRPEDTAALEPWAEAWARQISEVFVTEYLRVADGAPFLPADHDALHRLLDAYLLEKAAYEVTYELNNRPDWVKLPARGIRSLLRRKES